MNHEIFQQFNADKYIADNFTTSFMNNSKWIKVLRALAGIADKIPTAYYKLINEEFQNRLIYIGDAGLDGGDNLNMFHNCTAGAQSPHPEWLLYKEIEWIEFPSETKIPENHKISKSKLIDYSQDLNLIQSTIESIGQFELERSDKNLRLIAYR